jgi:endoglucanase
VTPTESDVPVSPSPGRTSSPTPGTPGCRATVSLNVWTNGFTANITVTNLGQPVTAWTVDFDVVPNVTLSQGWNGNYTQSGQHIAVRNASWNGPVPTGGSVTVGFNGAYTGTLPANPITNIRFNGTPCSTPV